ncbi:hypothetical protein N7281_01060 [Rickettsia hoogstraalii]|uniref:head-tail joining protein n=1 Tax=Rickettsia hoogstraalii TaxID=467174 RepID=UPI00058F564D|nr:hypothetical protein [Rickettsia hoogstraalii]KJV81256.1 hypothetical protein RHORCCE3_0439 [Rickettsia hoogstraalii str. RCCE3]MCX4083489.1 hypothetical protein [Rickettsia hoogstraalii]
MSFQEDLKEFLDIEQGFAITATLHLASGEKYMITGIMSEEYLEIDNGTAGVYGSKPIFECSEDDILEVEYGDLLLVHNKEYRIVGIKVDGTGVASLVLEREH